MTLQKGVAMIVGSLIDIGSELYMRRIQALASEPFQEIRSVSPEFVTAKPPMEIKV